MSITSARPSRSSDIKRRQTRYLFSMGVRTLCFVGAIVTTGVVRWVLVAGAFILPYVAVVIANASERGGGTPPTAFRTDDRLQLGPGEPDDDRAAKTERR